MVKEHVLSLVCRNGSHHKAEYEMLLESDNFSHVTLQGINRECSIIEYLQNLFNIVTKKIKRLSPYDRKHIDLDSLFQEPLHAQRSRNLSMDPAELMQQHIKSQSEATAQYLEAYLKLKNQQMSTVCMNDEVELFPPHKLMNKSLDFT